MHPTRAVVCAGALGVVSEGGTPARLLVVLSRGAVAKPEKVASPEGLVHTEGVFQLVLCVRRRVDRVAGAVQQRTGRRKRRLKIRHHVFINQVGRNLIAREWIAYEPVSICRIYAR